MHLRTPKTRHRHALFSLSIKPIFLFPHLRRPLLHLRENLSFFAPKNPFPLQVCKYLALRVVAKKRYQAVGFPCNRMLKLSSSRGIRIHVPVLSVSWSFEDHSVIIQAPRKGLIEHDASDTGGVPRWKSSCPDRLAEATISRYL